MSIRRSGSINGVPNQRAPLGVEIDNLDPAAQLDGTEKFATTQSSLPVGPTARQILGNPVVTVMGHARNRLRCFSHMTDSAMAFDSGITAGAVTFGSEPFVCWASGTDATVKQNGTSRVRFGLAECETGAQAVGYAGITSTFFPLGLNAAGTEDIKITQSVALSAAPTSSQDFTVQVGFMSIPTSLATYGMYFRAREAETNWQLVISNGTNTQTHDTGITVASSVYAGGTTFQAFRIVHDPVDDKVYGYINGALVVEEDILYLPNVFQFVYMGATTHKTIGNTMRSILVDAYAHDIVDANASGQHY